LIGQLNSINSYDNYHEFRWQLFYFTLRFVKAEKLVVKVNLFFLSIKYILIDKCYKRIAKNRPFNVPKKIYSTIK